MSSLISMKAIKIVLTYFLLSLLSNFVCCQNFEQILDLHKANLQELYIARAIPDWVDTEK